MLSFLWAGMFLETEYEQAVSIIADMEVE